MPQAETCGPVGSGGGKAEILAPAGSRESLTAAVRCGADAVYLGGRSLNARRGAENFDEEDLGEAVRYCHARGVKVYLTLNTLVFDAELPEMDRAVRTAVEAGVDAVIVQDLAVAAWARQRARELPLHASTQMSVHDAPGASLLQELGFRRAVLARELTRAEIAHIREETDIELELFVHGALCMSVSGQCYLSSMIGGRSGNRGLCAQPCRLPFSAAGCGHAHALSLKDLSLVEHAGELEALGIASLKIEGRMKRPEYVAAAVTACREALEGKAADQALLESVFSRSGFTDGYYRDRPGPGMFGVRRKEDVQSAAPVLKQLAALYQNERQSVPVELTFSLCRERPALLRAADGDGNCAQVSGPVPQEARTAPTTPEKAAASLSKTGGTPYTICNIVSEIDEGLILPASALNALRRDALEALTALRERPAAFTWQPGELPAIHPHKPTRPPILRARLARARQLTAALAEQVEAIILPAEEFSQLLPETSERYREKLLVELPGIVFNNSSHLDEILQFVKARGVTGAVAGGLGGIAIARRHGFTVHGDYSLNVTNSLALAEYGAMGLADLTLSFELELPKIRRLGSGPPRGILAYGHLPLMTTRNCPAGDCARCGRSFPQVADRKGNRFFVDCAWKVARLYNHVPLYLADRREELTGVDFLTLYFTRESPETCASIARAYRQGEPCEGEKTRGLYYRKVL